MVAVQSVSGGLAGEVTEHRRNFKPSDPVIALARPGDSWTLYMLADRDPRVTILCVGATIVGKLQRTFDDMSSPAAAASRGSVASERSRSAATPCSVTT